MHAVDTAGLFPHTARPVRGSSRTVKSQPPSPPLSLPIASTSNRPHRYLHLLQVPVTGLLLLLANGGDSGGDGGSDFTALELTRTGRAVGGKKPAV